ncbi:predicted protein [Botrytis cinerea T4]|uniref:Uncharacterized protein n=1 Tax=Botryotinia fuckeliana (strain T4) TaxID=999810 RepID=G2YTT5_BOTF4|nr:predicted protein [Botrytis cinerea T4]
MFPRHQEFRRALDDVFPATAARECQEQAKLTLHVVEPWKPTGCLATPQCKNGSLAFPHVSPSTANSTKCIALTPEHPKHASKYVRWLVVANHTAEHEYQTSPDKSEILPHLICM